MAVRPLFFIVASFAIVTLPLAFVLNIWQDEAYTLHTTSRDLAYALHESITFEAQAPLYFMILDAWRDLSRTVFFARCFSISCASAAICVVWVLSRRWMPNVRATMPTLAFAANPFVVWSALEIRLYALALLLSALLTLTFCEGFLRERTRPHYRVCYFILAAFALYTQYYLGTILIANALVLLQRRAWKDLRLYCFYLLGITMAAAPLALVLPRQLAAFRGYPVSFNILRAVGIVAENIEFVLPRGWISSWHEPWQLNAIYFVVAFTIGALLVRHKHEKEAARTFGIMTASIAGCFVFSIAVLHQQLVVTRQSVALLIPLLFTAIALLGREDSKDRRTRRFIEAAYIVCAVASMLQAYIPPIKNGDWKNVAEYVDARIAPSDTIAVFNPEVALPFGFYNTARNQVVVIPRSVDFDAAFDQRRFAIHRPSEVARAFAKAAPGGHVWLITSDQSPKAAAFAGRELLEEFVERRFQVVSVERFRGTTVRELNSSGPGVGSNVPLQGAAQGAR